MVERRIAPQPPRQRVLRIQPQRHCRHRRAEHISDHPDRRIRRQHRPERGPGENRHRPGRQHRQRNNDQRPLGPRRIDKRPGGRLRHQRQQPAHRRHRPHAGLAPMHAGDQEHVQIRPQRPPHVRQQKIHRIQCRTPAIPRAISAHRVTGTTPATISNPPTARGRLSARPPATQ